MVRIILSGCGGYMGRVVTNMVSGEEDLVIAAGIDPMADPAAYSYPVFKKPEECTAEGDVVLDFSTAAAADGLIAWCLERKLPAVLCATGYSEAQSKKVREAAKEIPVLRSSNMSLGVNLLMKLLKDAAKVLYPAGFDIDIVEKHHRRKLDAPSGTAVSLGESINEALGGTLDVVYDRSSRYQARTHGEIGMSAVRGGTLVGEHDVIFAGEDEVITFQHTAYSRAIFAKGALSAVRFLDGKPAGLYGMSDVIEQG